MSVNTNFRDESIKVDSASTLLFWLVSMSYADPAKPPHTFTCVIRDASGVLAKLVVPYKTARINFYEEMVSYFDDVDFKEPMLMTDVLKCDQGEYSIVCMRGVGCDAFFFKASNVSMLGSPAAGTYPLPPAPAASSVMWGYTPLRVLDVIESHDLQKPRQIKCEDRRGSEISINQFASCPEASTLKAGDIVAFTNLVRASRLPGAVNIGTYTSAITHPIGVSMKMAFQNLLVKRAVFTPTDIPAGFVSLADRKRTRDDTPCVAAGMSYLRSN